MRGTAEEFLDRSVFCHHGNMNNESGESQTGFGPRGDIDFDVRLEASPSRPAGGDGADALNRAW